MKSKIVTCGIVVMGAGGRMGSLILEQALADPAMTVLGLVESTDSPLVGKPHPKWLNGPKITADLWALCRKLQSAVIVDFSLPAGTEKAARVAKTLSVPLVTGTTGLDGGQQREVETASDCVPVIQASNMSIGINILKGLLRHISLLLPRGFDVELVEAHHRHKKDAPSGTAWELARLLKEHSRHRELSITVGRNAGSRLRDKAELTIHSLRAGGIVGQHRLVFCSENEQIVIEHTAFNRKAFVDGALKAALFAQNANPGLYSMEEVLTQSETEP